MKKIATGRNTDKNIPKQLSGQLAGMFGDAPVPFLDHRQFSAVDGDGNSRPITNYNIEILGAKHSDFDASSNHQVNLFMRDLSLMANDPNRLREVLKSNTWPGITYYEELNIIVVNPAEYETSIPR
ncbi:MAG: hypothetical protein ACOYJW_07680 [Candidatus Omnitrophota bacterium]|jgi:hypothetical protein